ncbi:MAG TPA: GAF domain-containing protein, partial [Anaerolineales bacterium]|nr:GAF domain-containing protein [Anaerolineales bacterium]
MRKNQSATQQNEQAQEVAVLYEALSEITATKGNFKHLSQTIADIIVNKFQATKFSIWLLEEDKTNLTRVAYGGKDIIESIDDISITSRGLMIHSLNTNKSIYEPDVSTNPSFVMIDKTTRSEFAVPLQAHGDVIGVINMESPDLDGFIDRTRRLVEAFAQNAALAIENAKLIDSLEASVTELKESQSRINFFLEHTSEGVYRMDYDPPIPTHLPFIEQFRLSIEHGSIGECNDAFAQMYGKPSRKEMIGKPYIDFYGEEGYEANLDTNLEFYRNGYKVDEIETEELNSKGEKVYFLNNVVGIIRDGLFVSTWGTQRDITPLKKAIAEKEKLNLDLEKSLAELKESQERINFFLANTSEGVYRVDYDPPIPIEISYEEQYKLSRERGRFGECNDAIARMYGFSSRDEMLGTSYN